MNPKTQQTILTHLKNRIARSVLNVDKYPFKISNILPVNITNIKTEDNYIHTVRFETICKCIDLLIADKTVNSKTKEQFKHKKISIVYPLGSIKFLKKYRNS